MDVAQLAQEITQDLTPLLPILTSAGVVVREGALKKIGEDGWTYLKALWSKLQPRVEAKPAALEAVHDLVAASEDAEARVIFCRQVRKLLEADPEWAAELSALVSERPDSVRAVVASGAASVAIGGNVSSSTIVTGSSNDIRGTAQSQDASK